MVKPDGVPFDQNLDFLGQNQTITFSYNVVATDNSGAANSASAPQKVTITITGTNDAPAAVADTVSGYEDTTITGSVATNDFDTDNGALLTYSLESGAAAGFVFNSDGTYSLDAANAAYKPIRRAHRVTPFSPPIA